MEIFNPYIQGLKFLFYSNKNGTPSISITKILLFLAYIVSIFAGFFQFLNLTSIDLECVTSPVDTQICNIKTNSFGTLFNISSLILVFSAFCLILFSSLKKSEKTSYTYFSIFLSGFITFFFFSFFIDLFINLTSFNTAAYGLGYSFTIIWVLMFEPLLFFSGVLIFLEIISQDYELRGYTYKTKIFLFLEILLILFVIGLGIYWLDNLHQDPNIIVWFFDITINSLGVGILVAGLEMLLFFIFISIFGFHFLSKRSNNLTSYDHLKGILPWIVFFTLIYFAIRSISAIFNFDYQLKTLSDIIDISLIFFIIFLAIMQVSSLQEQKKPISINVIYNPLRWTDYIPKYSKILLLLFLNTEIFYQELYQNAFTTLTGEANELVTLKAISLVSFVAVGFFSVYFRYKPTKPLSEGNGPIKAVKSEFNKIIQNLNRSKVQ